MKIAGEGAGKGGKEVREQLRRVAAASVRHISYIYERAVRRFPNSLTLWKDYIDFLKGENAVKALNSVFGRVISLHPKKEVFWIEAAVYELFENSNAAAARVLLQRALRANKKSKLLWTKYFELELWYSARNVQRRKVLNIEHNYEDKEKYLASQIVFKHATKAIPEVEFACNLHGMCYDISKDLAVTLEKELVTRFPKEGKLWEHMMLLKIEKFLENSGLESDDKSDNTDSDSDSDNTNRKKKEMTGRKKSKKSGSGPGITMFKLLMISCNAFDECSAILQEVLDLDDKAQFRDSLAHSIQLSVKRVKSFIFKHLSIGREDRGKSGEQINRKTLLKHVQNTFQKIDNLLCKLRAMGNTSSSSRSSSSSSSSNGSKSSNKTPVDVFKTMPMSVLLAYHSIHNLLSMCNLSEVASKIMFVDNSSAFVFEWLAHNQDLSKSNEWVLVADTVLESVLEESEASGGTSDLENACETICSRIELLTESTGGCGVLNTLFEVMDTMKMEEQLFIGLKRAINSSNCLHGMRGVFCSLLVTMATKYKGTDEVVNVYKEVEVMMRKSPHLLANAGMHHFYRAIIQLVLEECERDVVGSKNEADTLFPSKKSKRGKDGKEQDGTNTSSKITMHFGKTVIERAIVVCPTDSDIWDAYETIESWAGNHETVSHLKWKRQRVPTA